MTLKTLYMLLEVLSLEQLSFLCAVLNGKEPMTRAGFSMETLNCHDLSSRCFSVAALCSMMH